MKSSKSQLLKKKIISALLCILLSFSCVIFSSCFSIEDKLGNEISFFEQYIDSFKVVYSNSLEENGSCLKALENDFFQDVLSVPSYGLAYYYGSADSGVINNPNWFPDSIRMLVIKNSSGNAEPISNNIWKWTFKQNDIDNNPLTTTDDVNILKPINGDLYKDWKNLLWTEPSLFSDSGLYSTTFNNMYLMPLKIIMYEILLGYDKLTTFAPATIVDVANDNQAGLIAKVVDSGESLIKGNLVAKVDETATTNEEELASQNLKDYLIKLKEDYLKKTKYIGFTKANADNMIKYILEKVIGTDLVNYDYNIYGPNQITYAHNINSDITYYINAGDPYDLNGDNNISFYEYYHDSEGTTRNINLEGKIGGETYNFYNYRNYIERVASIIYAQTYDGESKDFIYERDMYNGTTKTGMVTYDYVAANGGVAKVGAVPALERKDSSAKPATFLRHFEGETFFEEISDGVPSGNNYTFKDSPKAEYQSILMITNPDVVFELEAGIAFNILAYSKDLVINIMIRYYDHNAKTLYTLQCDPATFESATTVIDPTIEDPAKETGYSSDFEVGFNSAWAAADKFIIPHVNKEGYNDLGRDEEINLGTEGAEFYKIIDSQNGYGGITVINENKMNCSFYEIVFDAIKNSNDPVDKDYTFKVTVSPLIY